jgi:O-antigen/teichoic acid export membrane protein
MTGLLALVLGKVPANGLNFLVAIALARLVSPTEQGTFALTLFVVVIGTTVLELGVNEALLFGRIEPDAVATHAAIRLATSGLLVLIGIVVALMLPASFEARALLPAIAVAQAAAFIYTTPKIVLEYEQRVPILVGLELAGVCIGAVAALSIARMNGGAWALTGQLVVSNGFIMIFGLIAARSRYRLRFNRMRVVQSLRQFGIPLGIGSSATLLLLLDVPIAALLSGRAGAGEYSKAMMLVMTFGPLASGATVRLVVPLFGRRQHDRAGLSALFSAVMSVKVGLLLPTYLLVAVMARVWFVPVLGVEWSAALVPFQFLTIYIAARLYIDDQQYFPSVVAGRPRVTLVMQLCWAAAAATLMICCGLAFGVSGVAAGLALSTVGAAVGITAWSSRFLHVSIVRPAVAALCYITGFALAAAALPFLEPLGPFVSTSVMVVVAAVMVGLIGRPVATLRLARAAIAGPPGTSIIHGETR